MSRLAVEAFPQDLPHSFIVDLSVLDVIDKSIYVKDIVVPKGVELHAEGDTVIATATAPMSEEELAAQSAAPVDVTAIKSEAEEKKAERDAGKAEVAE